MAMSIVAAREKPCIRAGSSYPSKCYDVLRHCGSVATPEKSSPQPPEPFYRGVGRARGVGPTPHEHGLSYDGAAGMDRRGTRCVGAAGPTASPGDSK